MSFLSLMMLETFRFMPTEQSISLSSSLNEYPSAFFGSPEYGGWVFLNLPLTNSSPEDLAYVLLRLSSSIKTIARRTSSTCPNSSAMLSMSMMAFSFRAFLCSLNFSHVNSIKLRTFAPSYISSTGLDRMHAPITDSAEKLMPSDEYSKGTTCDMEANFSSKQMFSTISLNSFASIGSFVSILVVYSKQVCLGFVFIAS